MSIKQKTFVIGSIILTLGGAALRIIQYIFAIDPETGYYALHSTSVLALQILSLVAVLFFLSSMFALKDEFVAVNSRFNSSLLNLAAIFLLITTAALVVNEIGDILAGSKKLISIPYIVIALLLIIYCLLIIFTDIRKIHGFFYLVPVMYCTVRLIELFIQYTGIANISSRTFDVLILCSLVLFFLYFAKTVINKDGKKRIFAYGLCAVYLIVVSVLPALFFMRKPENSVSIQSFLFTQAHYLAFLLFVLSVLIPNKVTKQAYEAAEQEKYDKEHQFDLEDEYEDYEDEEDE